MPARPLTLLALACAAGLTGCGNGPTHPAANTAQRAAPAVTGPAPGTTAPAPSGPAGTWTSPANIPMPVTDGTVITGLTRAGDRVTGLDARNGAVRWDVPLPGTAGPPPGLNTDAGPTVTAAPGAPIVVSARRDTPGSGLTPATTIRQVTALDPATGSTLWSGPAAGPVTYTAPSAVLTGTVDTGTATVAVDPRSGQRLWTRPAAPIGLSDGVALLSASDGGISTVVTGVDALSGRPLWSSTAWVPGAQGSRTTVLAATAGHVLAQTVRTELSGDVYSLRVRDLRTGQPVGPELPQPANPTALVDPGDGTVVVSEKAADGAVTGPYGVDMRTGRRLWGLTMEQSAKAEVVGGGLAWVDGADGYVALDDRSGTVRRHGLPGYPLLVLTDRQLTGTDTGLRSDPLPG